MPRVSKKARGAACSTVCVPSHVEDSIERARGRSKVVPIRVICLCRHRVMASHVDTAGCCGVLHPFIPWQLVPSMYIGTYIQVKMGWKALLLPDGAPAV